MSPRPPADSHARPYEVAIVGNDAVLAALPARPMQLAHALLACGFDFVVPVSWGEEVLAEQTLRALAARGAAPAIYCACPLQHARLLAAGGELTPFLIALVPPSVATARYLRAAQPAIPLRITVLGGCPDAVDASIDARISPLDLMRLLTDRGIVLARQPTVFESVIPPDRRRFLSLPGGCPTPRSLERHAPDRRLVTITEETFATELAEYLLGREHVLVDVSSRLACTSCGGFADRDHRGLAGRDEILRHEPPRAPAPVLDHEVELSLTIVADDVPPTVVEAGVEAVRTSGVEIPLAGPAPVDGPQSVAERQRIAVTPARAVTQTRRPLRSTETTSTTTTSAMPSYGSTSSVGVQHPAHEAGQTARARSNTPLQLGNVARPASVDQTMPGVAPAATLDPANAGESDAGDAAGPAETANAQVGADAAVELALHRESDTGPHQLTDARLTVDVPPDDGVGVMSGAEPLHEASRGAAHDGADARAPHDGKEVPTIATSPLASAPPDPSLPAPPRSDVIVEIPAHREGGEGPRDTGSRVFEWQTGTRVPSWRDDGAQRSPADGGSPAAPARMAESPSLRRRSVSQVYHASRAQLHPRVRSLGGRVLPRAYIRHIAPPARAAAAGRRFPDVEVRRAVAVEPALSARMGYESPVLHPVMVDAVAGGASVDSIVGSALSARARPPDAVPDERHLAAGGGVAESRPREAVEPAEVSDAPASLASVPAVADVLARIRSQQQGPARVVARDVTPPDEGDESQGSLAVYIVSAILVVALLAAISIVFQRAPTAPW